MISLLGIDFDKKKHVLEHGQDICIRTLIGRLSILERGQDLKQLHRKFYIGILSRCLCCVVCIGTLSSYLQVSQIQNILSR